MSRPITKPFATMTREPRDTDEAIPATTPPKQGAWLPPPPPSPPAPRTSTAPASATPPFPPAPVPPLPPEPAAPSASGTPSPNGPGVPQPSEPEKATTATHAAPLLRTDRRLTHVIHGSSLEPCPRSLLRER